MYHGILTWKKGGSRLREKMGHWPKTSGFTCRNTLPSSRPNNTPTPAHIYFIFNAHKLQACPIPTGAGCVDSMVIMTWVPGWDSPGIVRDRRNALGNVVGRARPCCWLQV